MKRNIFLKFFILILCVAFISISIAQKQKICSSNERIEITTKKELSELQTPKDFFSISGNNIIAVIDNSNLGYGNKVIKLIKDGKELNRIEESNCKLFNLNFSGDSKWLSYGIRNYGEVAKIKIYNLVSGELTTIDNSGKECGHLSFSPDNKKFVYSIKMDKGRKHNLVISDFYGNKKIICNKANFPKWSPIGDKIAFCRVEQVPNSNRWMGYIWIYNIKSEEEIKLFDSKGMARYTMTWSPDGKKIASHNGHNLGILDVNKDQQISIGSIEAHDPCWSPDGSKIAFIQPIFKSDNSEILEDSEIYLANSNGTKLINITNTSNITEEEVKWVNENQIAVKITNDFGVSKLQEIQFK